MDTYPPVIAELLALPSRMPLGPGIPDRAAADRLRPLDVAAVFAPAAVRDPAMAGACLAGLWLRFHCLDESHAISQEVGTPEGSFWHAILHRREPDPANSKYWWRKVGPHPVLGQLVEQAAALGYRYTDPFAFVDYCERVRGSGTPDEGLAERVQELEWRLLFAWCYGKAVEPA
ncbi:MAG TPA: hypothetical protein VJ739_08840 [Gemmataceae bacterium]|nr:hypothetical protein [Gemmataceae bacterium]